ncbi:hypothetical protein EDD18DRAFT_1103707 [Armillaria luteobubalina]|uniref:Uncharacterized protein n=1 Tax=Armillaria luteobubalina TaxID=153913 RepID=A0AA39Q893_9AGAR|nr:hypothetical protein EDD18DRAFT_1103707 [Armillaria luteobubalina]
MFNKSPDIQILQHLEGPKYCTEIFYANDSQITAKDATAYRQKRSFRQNFHCVSTFEDSMLHPPGPPSVWHSQAQENSHMFHSQVNHSNFSSTGSAFPMHEGIPTPSEDEDEDELLQAEQFEEDDDPDADLDYQDHLVSLSHPPIVTAGFPDEEEVDELQSSPVAPPQATGNPNGQGHVNISQNEDSQLEGQAPALQFPGIPPRIDFHERGGAQALRPNSARPDILKQSSLHPRQQQFRPSSAAAAMSSHSMPQTSSTTTHSGYLAEVHPAHQRPPSRKSITLNVSNSKPAVTTAVAVSIPIQSVQQPHLSGSNIAPPSSVHLSMHPRPSSAVSAPVNQVTAPSATERLPLLVPTPVQASPLDNLPAIHSDITSDHPTGLLDVPNIVNIEGKQQRHDRLSAEALASIKNASSKIWNIIHETTSMDSAVTADQIINHAFPTQLGAHKMTYWNIYLAKYKAEHPDESWDQDRVQQCYLSFKDSYPNDEWKAILDEYVKIMDLDAGFMTRGKHQMIFKNTFNELSKQLNYNAHRNGFEGILALVGANPTNDGPSMIAFHETELAQGFADQKLLLKSNWTATHLRAYVQNKKSDTVINLHRLGPDAIEADYNNLPYVPPSNAATVNHNETTDSNTNMPYVPFKILKPNNAKSAQMSCSVNLSAMMAHYNVPMCMQVPPNTSEGYPDYRSCPWKRLGKALQERNLLLTGWPPSLPLPIKDKDDGTYLSKGSSSLTDSQRVCLAKAVEEGEIKIASMKHLQSLSYQS